MALPTQTGITEITVEDLEFNLEKHKDCEYSESIYEFLFNFEKGQEKGFVSIYKEKSALSPERKGKSHYLTKNNSMNPHNYSESRSSVCLKLPERKKNGINSMHFGLLPLSPEKKGPNKSGLKVYAKSPSNLLLLNKTEKTSPYSSLSPKVKSVIIRSPGVRVKNINKKIGIL